MSVVERYTAFFNAKDTDQSGSLSRGEVKAMLNNKGYSDDQVNKMFSSADYDNDGNITLSEFLMAMGNCDPKEARAAEIKQIALQADHDGDGKISIAELIKYMRNDEGTVDSKEEESMKRIMAEMDKDGNEKVSINEFIAKMFPTV